MIAKSPSSFDRRVPAALVALAGCAIATYLGLYQAGLFHVVWDPLFDGGSAAILHSPVARMLPVPDALLGAAAYLIEFVLELLGGETRWQSRPLLTVVNMALVVVMGLGSLGLVAAQGLLVHAWCTLCLASACCSFVIAALSYDEMRAVLHSLLHPASA